jgi:YggT family protein
MTPTDSLFTHWYFHLPNLVLAALIYTLIGRYLLTLFFRRKPDAVILKVFASVTDPVLNAIRTVTPKVVPNGLVMVLAIVWLTAARMFLYLTVLAAGVRPVIGG